MPLFGDRRGHDPSAAQLPVRDRFLPGDGWRAYRATRTLSGPGPDGERVSRSGTGVSLLSQAEAEAMATERARSSLAAAQAGNAGGLDAYAYSVDRLLEPVIETLAGPAGGEIGRITLNSYGALVMNSRSALFADIDGNDGAARLEQVTRDRPELAFRVYGTPAGSRYFCTSHSFDPTAPETTALLEGLGSDPKYVLLCRIQRCFRARLTPKPWRAGQQPIAVSPTEGISRGDLDRFLGTMSGYAAARFLRVVGAASEPLPEIAPLVEQHDRWCQASSDRPLA
ncbi:MAG TPA: hypothetical protein VIN34_09320 [Candidatus Limnocylindria bacterium]